MIFCRKYMCVNMLWKWRKKKKKNNSLWSPHWMHHTEPSSIRKRVNFQLHIMIINTKLSKKLSPITCTQPQTKVIYIIHTTLTVTVMGIYQQKKIVGWSEGPTCHFGHLTWSCCNYLHALAQLPFLGTFRKNLTTLYFIYLHTDKLRKEKLLSYLTSHSQQL